MVLSTQIFEPFQNHLTCPPNSILCEPYFIVSKKSTPSNAYRYYSPKTRMFLPDGNLDLDRVETSLSIEDLWGQHHSLVCQWGTQKEKSGKPQPQRLYEQIFKQTCQMASILSTKEKYSDRYSLRWIWKAATKAAHFYDKERYSVSMTYLTAKAFLRTWTPNE